MTRRLQPSQTWRPSRVPDLGRRSAGFTLIEIMVVVGIAAVLLTLAVPAFVRRLAPQSMQRAVTDVTELLWRARADAILTGGITALQIRPASGSFSIAKVAGTAPPATDSAAGDAVGVSGGGRREAAEPSVPETQTGRNDDRHKTLHRAIRIEGLGINGEDWTEDEVAEVRFFPNGTCDAFSLVLLSENMERRNIYLEVVTGLASVESDPTKFRAR